MASRIFLSMIPVLLFLLAQPAEGFALSDITGWFKGLFSGAAASLQEATCSKSIGMELDTAQGEIAKVLKSTCEKSGKGIEKCNQCMETQLGAARDSVEDTQNDECKKFTAKDLVKQLKDLTAKSKEALDDGAKDATKQCIEDAVGGRNKEEKFELFPRIGGRGAFDSFFVVVAISAVSAGVVTMVAWRRSSRQVSFPAQEPLSAEDGTVE